MSLCNFLRAFQEGIDTFGVPSRIRTDKGRENIEIITRMIELRGMNRNSAITGPSTRNQRIERLWRELNRSVIYFYRELYYNY